MLKLQRLVPCRSRLPGPKALAMPGQIQNYGYVVYNRVSLFCEHNLGSLTATVLPWGPQKGGGDIDRNGLCIIPRLQGLPKKDP